MESQIGDWDLRLVDYWDQTTGAMDRRTLRLIRLSEPERMAACGQIRDAILKRLHTLSDSQLLQAAVSMIDEARIVANRLVKQCHGTSQHYVFLEADYQEGALDIALQDGNAGSVLRVLRNDAPVPGSTVSVGFPEQKLESRVGSTAAVGSA